MVGTAAVISTHDSNIRDSMRKRTVVGSDENLIAYPVYCSPQAAP
jgi:hypothetical protein